MTTKSKTTAPTEGAPTADESAVEKIGTQEKQGLTATEDQRKEGTDYAKNGGADLSESEVEDARKEGAKDAIKDAAKDTQTFLMDGNLPGEPSNNRFVGSADIQQFAHLLDQGPDEFAETVSADRDPPLAEDKVAGLYAMECNGQRREPHLRAMIKRLGLTENDSVPHASFPEYANPVVPASKLFKGN